MAQKPSSAAGDWVVDWVLCVCVRARVFGVCVCRVLGRNNQLCGVSGGLRCGHVLEETFQPMRTK